MVAKKTIGKVQFWIGIIILIIAIIGFVVSILLFKNLTTILPYSVDAEGLISFSTVITGRLFVFQTIVLSSLITFLMSIFLITQGLINKLGDNNGKQ